MFRIIDSTCQHQPPFHRKMNLLQTIHCLKVHARDDLQQNRSNGISPPNVLLAMIYLVKRSKTVYHINSRINHIRCKRNFLNHAVRINHRF